MSELISIKNLKVSFIRSGALLNAVNGVSFDIHKGEILCIAGESGSGKSVTAKAILQLNPPDVTIYDEGKILYYPNGNDGPSENGVDLLAMNRRQLSRIAGSKISMIFQDPLTSLNPVYKVGQQMTAMLKLHNPGMSSEAAKKRAAELLESVEIRQSERVLNNYPFELSGGMRQRVMIAMAISGDPDLLIADEPTTALDVTIQAQILKLLLDIHERSGLSIIFITHDLSVVYQIADRVIVFNKGCIVEQGSKDEIFYHPQMDYTKKLLDSVLRV